MRDPEKNMDEEMQEAFYKETKNIEDGFASVHRMARTRQLADMFPEGSSTKSFGRTLRFFCSHPESFFDMAFVLYEDIAKRPLDMDGMRELFSDLPEWPLFLAGWAQGMYTRSIHEHNYGARKNAGTVDLWVTLFLEHCDFLVTNDRPQYKALQVMNVLARRRRPGAKVLFYNQFRKRLPVSSAEKRSLRF
jgi:hypothetical protein